VSIVLALVLLLAGVPPAEAASQDASTLRNDVVAGQQRMADLTDQLKQAQQREQDLARQLGDAEAQAADESRRLVELDAEIEARQAQVDTERAQLEQLARAIYVEPDSLSVSFFEAGSLGEFLTRQTDIQSAAARARMTKAALDSDQRRLAADRAKVVSELDAQRRFADGLASQRDQLQATVDSQQQALDQLQAAQRQMQDKLAAAKLQEAIDGARAENAQAAIMTAGPVVDPQAVQQSVPACSGPIGGFPCGQCTWWVAANRPVNWSGNAWQWLANASAAGHATSRQAQPGSIVVYGPGTGYSVFGHVGVVTAVNGSTFTVSEMNYTGLGVVDKRESSYAGVEGFVV
jgi:surface antigen